MLDQLPISDVCVCVCVTYIHNVSGKGVDKEHRRGGFWHLKQK